MAYYCVHCDHEFEPEGEGRPRCPKCMRATEVKPLAQQQGRAEQSARVRAGGWAWIVGIAVAVIALGVGAWVQWGRGGESAARAEASVQALSAKLQEQGIDQDATCWIEASEPVVAFAQQAAADASGPEAKAEAVVKAIRARAQAGAFVPWSLSESRVGEALPPGELVAVLNEDGGRAELYPLEVVAFAVAALRGIGVAAAPVEIVSWPGAEAPLDPLGVAGYFALSVDGRVFDVYGGRSVPEKVEYASVSDAELVGAGLGLSALSAQATSGDTRKANRLSEAAVELWPKSPSIRCLRGAVLAAGGNVEMGLKEIEAAHQLRPDAARRYNAATSAMLSMELDRAAGNLNKLVSDYPDYALARVAIAAIQLQRGEVEEAERQLDLAERAAPDLSAVTWGRAELRLAKEDTLGARSLAERAFERRPTLEAHMRLARLQREASDLTGAAETVRQALDKVPSYRREALRASFEAAVGPAVMMDVDAVDSGENPVTDEPIVAGGEELDLSKGLKLLGDDGPEARGPSLRGSAQDDEPLLLLGDPSKLQLRDGESRLKLDLNE